MFLHFGVNTFTGFERGTGHDDLAIIDPVGLNANQWVSVAADTGISLMILTAKNHDGFYLWPSKYTDHSVKSSHWKGGKGDVAREFVDAAMARGVDPGLYLSPWDRHEPRYGHNLEYNEYYLAQLQELLTKYGSLREIGFDGFKGSSALNITYYFTEWFSMVKEMQSSINIFSDAGPDVRWVGNEDGFAGTTCWAAINRTSLSIGNASIVGLKELRNALDTIFSVNIAEKCSMRASSQRGGKDGGFGPENVLDSDHLWTYWAPRDEDDGEDPWIEIRVTDGGLRFNVVRIHEAVGLGQRIKRHEIYVDGKKIAQGTTAGYKRLHRLKGGVVYGSVVRVKITESKGLPLISSIGLHFDPFWQPKDRKWP
ncbi:hypothetical protein NL676_016352 [Syzygium grande]|nr:hypothetical protein NL676_016352 [Syzygium grande]